MNPIRQNAPPVSLTGAYADAAVATKRGPADKLRTIFPGPSFKGSVLPEKGDKRQHPEIKKAQFKGGPVSRLETGTYDLLLLAKKQVPPLGSDLMSRFKTQTTPIYAASPVSTLKTGGRTRANLGVRKSGGPPNDNGVKRAPVRATAGKATLGDHLGSAPPEAHTYMMKSTSAQLNAPARSNDYLDAPLETRSRIGLTGR